MGYEKNGRDDNTCTDWIVGALLSNLGRGSL